MVRQHHRHWPLANERKIMADDTYQSSPDERDPGNATIDQPDLSSVEDWLSEHTDKLDSHEEALKALLLTQMDNQRQQLPTMAPPAQLPSWVGVNPDTILGASPITPPSGPAPSPQSQSTTSITGSTGPAAFEAQQNIQKAVAGGMPLADAIRTYGQALFLDRPATTTPILPQPQVQPAPVTSPTMSRGGFSGPNISGGLPSSGGALMTPLNDSLPHPFGREGTVIPNVPDVGGSGNLTVTGPNTAIDDSGKVHVFKPNQQTGYAISKPMTEAQKLASQRANDTLNFRKQQAQDNLDERKRQFDERQKSSTVAGDPTMTKINDRYSVVRAPGSKAWRLIDNSSGATKEFTPVQAASLLTKITTEEQANGGKPTALSGMKDQLTEIVKSGVSGAKGASSDEPGPLPKTKNEMVKGNRYRIKGKVWKWDGSQLVADE